MQTGGAQLHELVSKKRLNKGSRRACHQFSMRPSTSPPPPPPALVSALGGGHVYITSSCPGSFGFCLGSDKGSPGRRLEGNLRSEYLICWVPPSVAAPLPEGLCSSQDSGRFSFQALELLLLSFLGVQTLVPIPFLGVLLQVLPAL